MRMPDLNRSSSELVTSKTQSAKKWTCRDVCPKGPTNLPPYVNHAMTHFSSWSWCTVFKILRHAIFRMKSNIQSNNSHCLSDYRVGGLEQFLFSHILGMSSSQLTFIFFRGVGLNHQSVIVFQGTKLNVNLHPSASCFALAVEPLPRIHELYSSGSQFCFNYQSGNLKLWKHTKSWKLVYLYFRSIIIDTSKLHSVQLYTTIWA